MVASRTRGHEDAAPWAAKAEQACWFGSSAAEHTLRFGPFFCAQGHIQQQGEGDGSAGAELRQLQPAAADGTAGRTQQLSGRLPEHPVSEEL